MRNHTATHLLHRALRDVLGEHAEQAGSLVAPDRLRFDFTHPRQVTPEQIRSIERLTNAWIRADEEVEVAQMSYTAARDLGAMALFGEKYGDVVRVVSVGCDTCDGDDHGELELCSRELCGGTHVKRTGEIGYFSIIGEGSISSGLRRIEAVTGRGAEEWVEQQRQVTRALSAQLAAPLPQIPERVDALMAELKGRSAELAALRSRLAENQSDLLLEQVKITGDNVAYVAARAEAANVEALRQLVERVRDRLRSGIVVLGTVVNDRPQIVVSVTPDLVKQGYHAGKIAQQLAKTISGGGGGKPEMAQVGGRDPRTLQAALDHVGELVDGRIA